MTYFVLQCFLKGFSLSLISFMKWVISTIVTIILVPKLQPAVSEYIESEFINNIGIGIVIFVFTLFLITGLVIAYFVRSPSETESVEKSSNQSFKEAIKVNSNFSEAFNLF